MKNSLLLFIIFIPAAAAFPFGIDLKTAEDLAIESSADIINAREQLKLSALQNRLNLRSFLPGLSISFNTSRITNLYSSDSDSLQLGLNITQLLFDGGRSLESLRLSEIRLNIQSAALERSIEELRDSVWGLFYGILLNKEKLELQCELLDISAEQLNVTAKKYEMGALTELDYLEAEVEVREMELSIMDTEIEAENLGREFAVLLGFDYLFFERSPLELRGNLDREYPGLQLLEDDHGEWSRIAIDNNPELKERRVELEQIKTNYELTKRSMIPSVSLEAGITLGGSRFPLQEPGGSLKLDLQFPYRPAPVGIDLGGGFQGSEQSSGSGRTELSVLPDLGFITDERAAELRLHQAAGAIEESETALARSIRSTLKQLENMRLRLTILRSTQELQKKRLSILEKRNAIGEVTESELLEARVEYYAKETGLLEEVMGMMQTERAFEKLIGCGFGELEALAEAIRKDLQ